MLIAISQTPKAHLQIASSFQPTGQSAIVVPPRPLVHHWWSTLINNRPIVSALGWTEYNPFFFCSQSCKTSFLILKLHANIEFYSLKCAHMGSLKYPEAQLVKHTDTVNE